MEEVEVVRGTWGGTNKGNSWKGDTASVVHSKRSIGYYEGPTHRTFELGPLPPAVLEDVVHADVGTSELLASSFLGASDGSVAAIAVAISGHPIVVEAAMGAGASALVTGSGREFVLRGATATSA